jgi:hypothetical protein
MKSNQISRRFCSLSENLFWSASKLMRTKHNCRIEDHIRFAQLLHNIHQEVHLQMKINLQHCYHIRKVKVGFV